MGRKRLKETIIEAYSTGNFSLRALEVMYGVPSSTICRWTKGYSQMKKPKKLQQKDAMLKTEKARKVMSDEVVKLQAELEKARLENKLLNTMIDVAEENLGVKIRKKAGARRS